MLHLPKRLFCPLWNCDNKFIVTCCSCNPSDIPKCVHLLYHPNLLSKGAHAKQMIKLCEDCDLLIYFQL